MSKMIQLNRVLIAIDAYVRGHRKGKEKKDVISQKSVLIVFQQVYGDAIIFQSSLSEYTKLYPNKDGYNVKLLVRPQVAKFMKSVCELPKEIEFCEIDFKKFLEDFTYYKKVVKQYKGTADILIVPGTSLSAEIFSAASDAKRKIGLIRSFDVKKPFTMAIFSKLAYTEKVRPNKEEMMLQRHRLLINYLGDDKYKAKLPTLQTKEKIIDEWMYCVMCPGSSKAEKCWPLERFAEIADYIVDKYNMNVHLCGGKDEIKYEEAILSMVKYPERIISHIGKTTFTDWSAIVQHANLVIGNDSATVHLAAASRRKTICIAGVYDKYQFFPYKVDSLSSNDCLPITITKDMPCEWCRTIGYDAGAGNSDCKNRIKNGKCAKCIELITESEVKKQINILMEKDLLTY